jgi:hypothetical protein
LSPLDDFQFTQFPNASRSAGRGDTATGDRCTTTLPDRGRPRLFILDTLGWFIQSDKVMKTKTSSAGLPEAYAKNYLVAASTLSPDKRLAVMYPKRDPEEFAEGKDYVVSLRPFAVVGSLDTKWPYFYHKNHAGISATWSGNSSVALVTIDSKWGPGEISLLEFAEGKLKRATNLLAKIHALLLPDYRKVKPQRYNDYFDFIFEDDSESTRVCHLDGTKLVQIDATATTDPNHMAGMRVWDARVRATWDIAQAKFTSQEVMRLFGGVRKENGED